MRRIVTAREQWEMTAPWREHKADWSHDPSTDTYTHPNGHVIRPSDEEPGSYQLWAPTVRWKGPPGLAKDRRPSPDLQSHMDWAEHTGAAHPDAHPDLHESFATHGSVHTHGGRVLPAQRTAVADRATQESRLADSPSWANSKSFQPLPSAIQGARGYASKLGLSDPHAIDYSRIRTDPSTVRSVGRHYDSLPNYDPNSAKSYDALAKEVRDQYDHLTNNMGVRVNSVDHDPYSDVHEMLADVKNNKRLNVLGTRVTGSHPYLSDDDNDKFRAVHDYFGHAATGRSFDRHGELAAYMAHAQMFTPQALPAAASETKGQNTSLILNGHFAPQKMATMDPQYYWHDLSQVGGQRSARRANMDPITLYTKPECPQCKMTQARLEHHGIPYQAIDLTADPEAYNHVVSNLGYTSAPVVDAGNGNHWFGFRPDRIKALLG